MKNIKLCYSPLYNAGDLLNVDLIERLSGCKVQRSKTYNADMMAIGGALYGLQYSTSIARRIAQAGLSIIYGNKPLYVWGSGFLYDSNNNGIYRANLKVCALRGKKTKDKLSRLTGIEYDVPLADAGLLVDMLIDQKVEVKYEIGVIPHFSQINERKMQEMCNQPNVYFIDIRRTPKEVAYDIASCSCIASSSLHGLIFADSLHIPSMHILGETELPGGNFKFEDYYSSYGLEDKPWKISERFPKSEDIFNTYRIDINEVEKKKKELIESFPKIFKEL